MNLNGPDYPSWKGDPQAKRYSATVAAACLVGLILIVLTAGVCAVVNLTPTR